MPAYDYLTAQANKNRLRRPAIGGLPNVPNRPWSGMGNRTLEQTTADLRRDNIQSALRGAYMPATNPAEGDPLNLLGSQVGMIGESRVPMAPVGAYAAGRGLDRMRGERGGIAYSPQYGYQMTGHTAFDGGMQAKQSAGDAWAARNAGGYTKAKPLRVDAKNANIRTGSNKDALRIALNRMRGGMSLNPDEEMLLGNMDPAMLQALQANSFAGNKAAAKETVRQRGLARGDARASARNYREMTAPRNVMLGTGATVSRPGMPAPLAGAMTLSGGGPVDPMAAALSGLMPSGAAAAFGETAARERTANLDRASGDMRGMQGAAIALLQSDDPVAQAQGAAMLQGMGGFGQKVPPVTGGGPLAPGEEPSLGLTNDDALALENRRGDDFMIEQYGRSKGWSADKIAAAKREYGSSILDRGADWAYGQITNPPLRSAIKKGNISSKLLGAYKAYSGMK